MDDKKLHRCFTFSEDQLKHLRSKKYKIDRMECFMSLVDLADARKLFSFTAMPVMAMASACSTFVSQNCGANQPERVRKGMKECIGIKLKN